MPLGPFDEIPITRPPQKVRLEHINELRRALTNIQDAYDVAVADGFVGTRANWLASLKGDPVSPAELAAAVDTEVDGRNLIAGTDPRVAALRADPTNRNVALGGDLAFPEPALLIAPGGSRDRDGAVTPTVSGGVTTTAGEYGTAWVLTDGQSITLPSAGSFSPDAATILIRLTYPRTGSSNQDVFTRDASSVANRIRILLAFERPRVLVGSSGSVDSSDTSKLSIGVLTTIGLRYEDGALENIYNTTITAGGSAFAAPGGTAPWRIGPISGQTNVEYQIEGVLVFDTAISDDDIARIVAIDAAWSWANVTGTEHTDRTALGSGARAIGSRSTAIGGVTVTEDDTTRVGADVLDVVPSSGGDASVLRLRDALGVAREIAATGDGGLSVDGQPISGAVSQAEKASILTDLAAVDTGLGDITDTVTAFLGAPGDELYQARDRFADADGTAIASHTPDTGVPWVNATGNARIVGNMLVGATTNVAAAAIQSPIAEDVRASITFIAGTDWGAGAIVRAVDSTTYWFGWYQHSVGQLRIYQVTGGVATVITSRSGYALTPGQLYTMHVTARGRYLTVEIPGKPALQYDTLPAGGSGVGVRIGPEASGVKVPQFSARPITVATPTVPAMSATNAASPLVLPTMYGDTQGTHPDVLDFGVAGWQGWRYWMAWTPHTDGNTVNENPSITVSNDGTTWTTPDGLTNPVVPWTGVVGSWNSDPDLVFIGDTLYMVYRTSNYPEANMERLWVIESRDGVVWTNPVNILSVDTSVAGNRLTSPALLYRRGRWHMWHIVSWVPRWTWAYRTATSIYGPWSDPVDCIYPTPDPKIDIWHVNVIDELTHLTAIYSSSDRNLPGSGTNGELYVLQSYDGVHWDGPSTPLLTKSVSGWDDDKLYRSALVPTSTGYDLYYSAHGTGGKWHIGRTAVTVTP